MEGDLLAAIARWGLQGPDRTAAVPLADEPLADEPFGDLVLGCESHRLVGFLGAAVAEGGLPVTAGQRERIEQIVQSWMAAVVRLEGMAVRAIRVLREGGIEHRALKGLALANTLYLPRELRVFGDIDLLIPGPDFGRAAQALVAELGGERALPELRPGFDRRFGREILVRVGAREIDLHRTFVDGPYGFSIVLADVWAQGRSFEVGGETLVGLVPEQQFIHACLAAVLGDWPPRMAAQRDLLELLRPGLVDGGVALEVAQQWKVSAVVGRAVTDAVAVLGVRPEHPIVGWAEQYAAGRLDRVLIASYRGRARGYTSHLAALARIPGVRDRASYARAIALPDTAYRRARGLPASGLLGRWIGRARGR